MKPAPLDILYTWVDDSFPGFREEWQRYARNAHDLSPNRTRDNLNLLKYSLRSVERFAPWRGKIFIVTCRPQVPRWLRADHPDLRIVYLDEFMPADEVPSFNAFAIESHVHKIPALSQRYVHFNDDMLLAGPVAREMLEMPDGRLQYYFVSQLPPANRDKREEISPFEAGRTNVARLLDREFGLATHPQQAHHARIIDKGDMERLVERYKEQFARTRAARFRAFDTILPHMLLAAYLVKTGAAQLNGPPRTKELMQMVQLRDSALSNWAELAWTKVRRPRFLALNDDFGVVPHKRAEDVARRFLTRLLPEPSAYEMP